MSLLKTNTPLGYTNSTENIGPVGLFNEGIGVAPLSFITLIDSIHTADQKTTWNYCFSIDKDYSIFLVGELM